MARRQRLVMEGRAEGPGRPKGRRHVGIRGWPLYAMCLLAGEGLLQDPLSS